MKKWFPAFLVLLVLPVTLFAQIRDYVFIVRPVFSDSTTEAFKNASDHLSRSGYRGYAEYMTEADKGRFGSGFLFVGSDGTNYVLSNWHVVAGADTVTVEKENTDGKRETIKGGQIVAVNEDLDLALVRIEPTTPYKRGLTLSDSVPGDGADVFSAGYPGLGGEPAWQFGKGTVTNSVARIKELVDPKLSTLIQHSAEVDGGNSGGPLLVASGNQPGGYRVVGINTWKAYSRQAANFAVPAPTIKRFVDETLAAQNNRRLVSRLTSATGRFTGVYAESADPEESRPHALVPLVSSRMVEDLGPSSLVDVLSKAPSDFRKEVIYTLTEFSPLQAMRLSVAWVLDRQLSGSGAYTGGPASDLTIPSDKKVSLTFTGTEGASVETSWIYEQGQWRMDTLVVGEFDSGKKDSVSRSDDPEKGDSLFSAEPVYHISFYVEPALYVDSHYMINAGLVYSGTYVAFGVISGLGQTVGDDSSEDSDFGLFNSIFRVNGLIRLQYPFVVRSTGFLPYVSYQLGFQMGGGEQWTGILSVIGAGMQFCFGEANKFVVGVGYVMDIVKPLTFGFDEEDGGESHYVDHGIALTVGMAW